MPRYYKRKTDIISYTPEQLEKAINIIRNEGKKIREVGRNFNIPESTLRKRLLQNRPEPPRLGRKSTFTKEIETALKNYVLTLAKLFYGLTPKELRRLAFRYAEENKIFHNFNREKGVAGKDWMYGFLRRNPEITLRQPEGTSLNRIVSFNREETDLFYGNIEKLMKTYQFEPTRIFNIDETGITTVQKKCPKIYGPKGVKKVGAAISAERGRTITAIFCFSAAGCYIPPMLVYPRKRMPLTLQKNGPIGASYKCSKNGWVNAEIFVQWLNHFQKYAKATVNDPVLMILDNHSSHISIEAYEFCKRNCIHMVSLPPHTSDHLQPLDLTFFSPLKSALYREYDLYLSTTGHQKITEYDIAELLNRAFMKVATMEKAVSGFRSAGIVPLDPNKFNEHDFAPANDLQELVVDACSDTDNSNVIIASEQTQSPENIETPEQTDSQQIPHTTTDKESSASEANSFFLMAPIPKKNKTSRIKSKSRVKQHSQILTSTPIKHKLEEANEKRKIKQQKTADKLIDKEKRKSVVKRLNLQIEKNKNEVRKKKKNEISDSSDTSDLDVSKLCDDEDSNDLTFNAPSCSKTPNEFCYICGEIGKDQELWYRCVICSTWNHAECTGADSPKDYICDFCLKGK